MANNDNANKFVSVLTDVINNEIKITPQLLPATVVRKNSDGTYNVRVPNSNEEIKVNNQTPFVLEAGDVVSLFLKNRDKLNYSFIVEAKGKSKSKEETFDYEKTVVTATEKTEVISGVSAITMSASGWSSGVYSFENFYPSDSYDIIVELNGDSASSSQVSTWALGKMCGSATANKIYAKGTVPTVDLPVIVKFNKKEVTFIGEVTSS